MLHNKRIIIVSTHDMVSLCKLQSLGKFHKEKMFKATCSAIILAYATEEETIYHKRKRSIWTEVPFLYTSLFTLHNRINSCQNSLFEVICDILRKRYVWYKNQRWTGDISQTYPQTFQTVAQAAYCATKFNRVWISSNCFTNRKTTLHKIKEFVQQPGLCKMFDHTQGP